ncbi:MAG: hypothetical protein IJ879_06830 [Muribaculaceae bacterium]|nr:hypothetical protein [Muribaculaceae bacterium]
MALVAVCSSCIEDGFTTSPSDVLAFNCDTLAFDTVITLQGTATKQMVVYNRSKKQINISSIKVAGLSNKGRFHLNVDGIRGDEFHNVEIRGNDSIYIFVEAYLDEMGRTSPRCSRTAWSLKLTASRSTCCLQPGGRMLSACPATPLRATPA